MSFAFSTVEPNVRGYLDKPPIPLSRFLGAAWDQGVHDSMGASIYRISEQLQMEGDLSLWGLLDQQAGRTLSPDEASAQYGTTRLRFTEPVKEGTARLLRERHDENERRNYLLSEGASSKGRVAASFGVGMLGSLSNPVDFALMFFPAVGSEAASAKLGALGAGTIRRALARGLVTEESIAKVLAPKVLAAAIDGVVGQAIAEVPLYISNRMDQTPYTLADSITNVALGGAFAAGLRLALTGAGRLFKKLSGETREAAMRKAATDFLAGKDIEVHKLVELDEAVIRERVKVDFEREARAEAVTAIDKYALGEIRNTALSDLGLDPDIPRVDQPNLIKIAEDWLPIFKQQGKDVTILAKLLSTVRDGTPTLIDLENLAGQLNLVFDPMERKFPSQYYIAPDPERARMQRIAGVRDEDLRRPGQVTNAQRRQQAAQLEAERKLRVQQRVDVEREKAIRDYVERLREQFDPEQETRRRINEETLRQQKDGKVLTDEQVTKYKPSSVVDETDIAVLEKDVEDLKKGLDITDEDLAATAGDEATAPTMVDHIVAALEKLKMDVGDGKTPRMNSGIPPEIWNAFISFVIEGVKAGERLYRVVEAVLQAHLEPKHTLDEKTAITTLVRWAEEGPEGVAFSEVAAAAQSLKRYAKPSTVYRAAIRTEARGIAGWSTKKVRAEEFRDRSTPNLSVQEYKAQKVITHKQLLDLLYKHGLLDKTEREDITFIIEEEAFVLDFIVTDKQADEIRAKFYDTTAELRPAAMLSPDELRAEAKSALIASVSEKGITARGRFHGMAYERLNELTGGNYDYENNWDYMRGREGFITVNQRHVTRAEMQALVGESESFAMSLLKDSEVTGDIGAINQKIAALEWERRDAVALELRDFDRAQRWMESLDIEIQSLKDQIDAIERSNRNKSELDSYHSAQLDLHIDVGEPVNKAAWDRFHKEAPAGYAEKGDFYVPTGKKLSDGLSEKLLLDHLERCIIK